jgi:hypothetical protein
VSEVSEAFGATVFEDVYEEEVNPTWEMQGVADAQFAPIVPRLPIYVRAKSPNCWNIDAPPLAAAQPVAFPFARIPVGACPVGQIVGVDARAVAVAALPVVLLEIVPVWLTIWPDELVPTTAALVGTDAPFTFTTLATLDPLVVTSPLRFGTAPVWPKTLETAPPVAHPVAFPLARIPVGAWPVEQSVGVDASAVAVAAFPLVLAA